MKKWTIKLSIVMMAAFILLVLVDRLFFSFGKMQLFGLWMMHEQKAGMAILGTPLDSQQIVATHSSKYVDDIADMLATEDKNSIQTAVAMTFAEHVKDNPKVQAQLHIISRQHPKQKVRCYWQQQLQQGAHITIVNNPGVNERVSNYLLLPETNCPLNEIAKPISIETALKR